MVEYNPEPRLELLAKLPRAGDSGGRVMQDVADEVEAGDFAGDGGAVDEEGRDYYVAYLKVK